MGLSVTVATVGQGRQKADCMQRLAHICLPINMNVLTCSSSHWLTGIGKLKSGLRRFDLFGKVEVTYSIYPVRAFRAVHDNVAVAVIVSEI